MGKRAYTKIYAKGERLSIPVSAPLPGIDQRPQTLTILWQGKKKKVVIDEPGWRSVSIDVGNLNQDKLTLRFEAGYTFNPAREGVSGDKRNLGVYLKEPTWTD